MPVEVAGLRLRFRVSDVRVYGFIGFRGLGFRVFSDFGLIENMRCAQQRPP